MMAESLLGSPLGRIGWLLLAAGALPRLLPGQTLSRETPRGQIVERLVSPADTSQSYAVYLPSAYRPDTVWPVLFIMDARGRALVPLRLFQPAAERLGYIAISSYNSFSDGPPEPTYRAFNAMLADVQRSLSIDGSRIYLAGFSGTARLAWVIASQLRGHLAGIIGAGAALPAPLSWFDTTFADRHFGFVATVGTTDFNYDEVHQLDRALAARSFPHHLETFEGPHSWPPERVSSLALEWLDLHAMRRGSKPVNQRWVDSLAGARSSEAARSDSAGRPFEAFEAYRAIAADFDGLTDVSKARERAAVLGRAKPVRHRLEQMEEAGKRERKYAGVLAEFMQKARKPGQAPQLQRAKSSLRIERLQQEAKSTEDTVAALAAQRMLENVFVSTSFYLPRELFESRRFEDAVAVLRVAREIRPDHGGTCLTLAQAYAQLGRTHDGLESLACAAADQRIGREAVESDSLLSPLAKDPEYRRIVGAMHSGT